MQLLLFCPLGRTYIGLISDLIRTYIGLNTSISLSDREMQVLILS